METEMGPLSSPGMTSYRLPIVTIGLSLTVYAVLRMFQTDGRISLAIGAVGHYALKCIGRQKCSHPAIHVCSPNLYTGAH